MRLWDSSVLSHVAVNLLVCLKVLCVCVCVYANSLVCVCVTCPASHTAALFHVLTSVGAGCAGLLLQREGRSLPDSVTVGQAF